MEEITLNGKTWLLTEKEEMKETQSSDKEWEIVSFRGKGNNREWRLAGIRNYCEHNNSFIFSLERMIEFVKDGTVYIESVRRLSDNEVFTVREDEIKGLGKIIKIEIWHGHLFLYSSEYDYARLDYAVKQPTTPKVLLTTNEGVQVTNPEQEIYYCYPDFDAGKTNAGNLNTDGGGIFKKTYFFSKESLDNYITQNKPVPVTAIELAKAINFTSDQLNQLVDFFKAKNK